MGSWKSHCFSCAALSTFCEVHSASLDAKKLGKMNLSILHNFCEKCLDVDIELQVLRGTPQVSILRFVLMWFSGERNIFLYIPDQYRQ